MNFYNLTDPHRTRPRIWFRRVLIAAVAVMFALLNVPEACQEGEVNDAPQQGVVGYACSTVTVGGSRVIGGKVVDIESVPMRPGKTTWYECTKTFADGSWFVRLGDLKP